jgi:RNA polymerase sigma-70 factor (ECF subfamily)
MTPTEFVQQLQRCHRQIYSCIYCLVANWSDADEVYQETCKVLWEKRDQFEMGTSFRAWACRIATNQARHMYRKRVVKVIPFSDVAFSSVERAIHSMVDDDFDDSSDRRHTALRECTSRLRQNHLDLIVFRYAQSLSLKAIAERLGRSDSAVSRMLSRIHVLLFDCVKNAVAKDAL